MTTQPIEPKKCLRCMGLGTEWVGNGRGGAMEKRAYPNCHGTGVESQDTDTDEKPERWRGTWNGVEATVEIDWEKRSYQTYIGDVPPQDIDDSEKPCPECGSRAVHACSGLRPSGFDPAEGELEAQITKAVKKYLDAGGEQNYFIVSAGWYDREVSRQIEAARVDPFGFVEPCEPECSPERHAYHQGQWDMAVRMGGQR
jgi:hypothetical protein